MWRSRKIRETRLEGLKRRSKAWLFFIVIGLAVLFFGHFLENMAHGMGGSIISLGFVWIGISFLFLIVNLYVMQIEKRNLANEDPDEE
ncbi:MAG: hypothetical protein GY865_00575 [candidate division Zixibacteria bacterium]|nr:hypothetical protein [candidate division Zixibacteria bacterium]